MTTDQLLVLYTISDSVSAVAGNIYLSGPADNDSLITIHMNIGNNEIRNTQFIDDTCLYSKRTNPLENVIEAFEEF